MWFKAKLILKPLPMNMPQFEDWSRRIIREASLPTDNIDTQQFALAGLILQSSPTEFFRPDEYYVNALRKSASDQLAMQVIEDLREKRQRLSAVTPSPTGSPVVPNGVHCEAKEN